MARQEKTSVDYFPFLCKEGRVLFFIEAKYNNDGFATWVKILRQLAVTSNHYLDLSSKMDMMFLAAKCKVSEQVLVNIISDLVDMGEFDKSLWKDNKIVWSQKFIDNIQDAYKKRNNKCISYEGLLSLLASLGIRKLPKSTPKVPVNTHIIEENNKEENIILNDVLSFDDFWKKYPNKVAKEKCKDKYEKLPENDLKIIKRTIDDFVLHKPFESYSHPNPETYLNQKRWNDELPTQKQLPEKNENVIYFRWQNDPTGIKRQIEKERAEKYFANQLEGGYIATILK